MKNPYINKVWQIQTEINALRNTMIYDVSIARLIMGGSLTEANFNQKINDMWGVRDEDSLPVQRAKALKRWFKYH